jgi:predicted O-methyltransferase YrrM
VSRLSRRYVTTKGWETYLRLFVHPPKALVSIPGYLHPLEGRFLHWLAGKVPKHGLALEVGSFKGKSACFIASGLDPSAHLACVDTWHNDAMTYDAPSDVMLDFLRNASQYPGVIETHRGRSSEVAANWTRPIDFLFIDGDHSYEGCRMDVEAWLAFVKPGGWVAFHDSSEEGVARAISEFFPKTLRGPEVNVWSVFAALKR